jgi:hypothetical protein
MRWSVGQPSADIQLLFDSKTEDLLNSTYIVLPEPPNVQKQEDVTTTFVNAARSLPHGALGSLNVDRIMYLVFAAFNAAKERFWALREDPSYFAEVVRGYME